MGLLSLLRTHPLLFVALAFLLLYSIILHEMAHGVVALWFGDDTAKSRGRLTLNPLPHIDWLGLLMLFAVGFGWAKPVPVNYGRLGNSRLGLAAVSLAGVAVNISIAIAALFLLNSFDLKGYPAVAALLGITARINIMLGAFNLIPIPPLDGSKVLLGFLPEGGRRIFAGVERFGFFILIALLYTGALNPVIDVMERGIQTVALIGAGIIGGVLHLRSR